MNSFLKRNINLRVSSFSIAYLPRPFLFQYFQPITTPRLPSFSSQENPIPIPISIPIHPKHFSRFTLSKSTNEELRGKRNRNGYVSGGGRYNVVFEMDREGMEQVWWFVEIQFGCRLTCDLCQLFFEF